MSEIRTTLKSENCIQNIILSNVSHEIRTPMNVVIGMTNLLLKTSMNDQQAKYINAIKHSSENLLVIINDILDLSKIEAGKIDFENETDDEDLPARLKIARPVWR